MGTRTVFISYNQTDRKEAERVETVLESNGISTWRDQNSIYAGEKWPKLLGESIAANDVVLLVWSKHAAASEFVELEWCIDIALKKKITLSTPVEYNKARRNELASSTGIAPQP